MNRSVSLDSAGEKFHSRRDNSWAPVATQELDCIYWITGFTMEKCNETWNLPNRGRSVVVCLWVIGIVTCKRTVPVEVLIVSHPIDTT